VRSGVSGVVYNGGSGVVCLVEGPVQCERLHDFSTCQHKLT
jgi:hypothetical protein